MVLLFTSVCLLQCVLFACMPTQVQPSRVGLGLFLVNR